MCVTLEIYTKCPRVIKKALYFYFILFLFIYLFLKTLPIFHERQRARKAESQAEGKAGSMQGARCGTRSRGSGTTLQVEGRCLTAEPPRHPYKYIVYWFRVSEESRELCGENGTWV